MAQHTHAITSIKALQRTIERDRDTSPWFMYLITRPAVKAEIISEINVKQNYDKLKLLIFYQRILWPLFFILCAATIYNKLPLATMGAAIILPTLLFLQFKTKKMVSQISVSLLSKDFERSEFAHKTLYQIGEFYSRKYGVSSLLTSMTSVDTIVRRALFYVWIFATLVNPIGIKQFWLLLIGTYFFIYTLIDISLIYNRVK